MSPDFRNATHKKWGYLACRLVKSISYGHVGITNSPINAKFVDDTVICKPTVKEMFDGSLNHIYASLASYIMCVQAPFHTHNINSFALLSLFYGFIRIQAPRTIYMPA